jgi:hypothetical protein
MTASPSRAKYSTVGCRGGADDEGFGRAVSVFKRQRGGVGGLATLPAYSSSGRSTLTSLAPSGGISVAKFTREPPQPDPRAT